MLKICAQGWEYKTSIIPFPTPVQLLSHSINWKEFNKNQAMYKMVNNFLKILNMQRKHCSWQNTVRRLHPQSRQMSTCCLILLRWKSRHHYAASVSILLCYMYRIWLITLFNVDVNIMCKRSSYNKRSITKLKHRSYIW